MPDHTNLDWPAWTASPPGRYVLDWEQSQLDLIVSNLFGYHADFAAITVMFQRGASGAEWLAWFGSDAAPALGLGLIIMAVVAATLGYVVAVCFWRWRVMARRRHRLHNALYRATQGAGA